MLTWQFEFLSQAPSEALEQQLLDAQLSVTQQHFAAALDAAMPSSLRSVALPEVFLDTVSFQGI